MKGGAANFLIEDKEKANGTATHQTDDIKIMTTHWMQAVHNRFQ